MPAFRFPVDGKQFENKGFRKRWFHDSHVISLTSKMTGDCCVILFVRRSVDGKHLMRFQSETSVFKFLRSTLDGALVSW